jgi:hypothetical protein
MKDVIDHAEADALGSGKKINLLGGRKRGEEDEDDMTKRFGLNIPPLPWRTSPPL